MNQKARELNLRDWIRRNWKPALGMVFAAILLAVCLEALNNSLMPPVFQGEDTGFYRTSLAEMEAGGTYLHSSGRTAYRETWNPLRLGFLFVLQMAVLVILFPMGLGRKILQGLRKAAAAVRSGIRDRKGFAVRLAVFLAVCGGGFFLFRVWAEAALGKSNRMIDLFSLSAGLGAAVLLSFRKTLGRKPELIFLCLALLIGGQMAFLLPDTTSISWDDGAHYQNALNYSMLGHVRFTRQDFNAMESVPERDLSLGEEHEAYLRKQEEAHQSGAIYVTGGLHFGIGEFWLAMHGLGLFLGRLLHLSYGLTWSLGRFTGLLAYAAVGYFAIRRLRSGKMMLAAVLLIPQQLFLAANYSYDPGVTCLTALGLSYSVAQWQESGTKISRKDQMVILEALFLGCLAKQVYFPLLVIPMLLPKDKFESREARRRFLWADISLMAVLILSFALPFILGDGAGDQRGGENVSAFGQAGFILSDPLRYTSILFRFLGQYLHPANAGGFLTFFGFLGSAPNAAIYLILLTAVAFTDKCEPDTGLGDRVWVRTVSEGLLAVALVLVATSLYVAYTAVGSGTIEGCQPRYLAPLIFPAMMFLGSGRIRNGMNRPLYNGLILGTAAFVGYAAVLYSCINLYG